MQFPYNWSKEMTEEEYSLWLLEKSIPAEIKVPNLVSAKQARLALLQQNLLDYVEAAIASLQGKAGKAAQIEWEFSTNVRRDSQLVAGIGQALNLTQAQIDQLFIFAATL